MRSSTWQRSLQRPSEMRPTCRIVPSVPHLSPGHLHFFTFHRAVRLSHRAFPVVASFLLGRLLLCRISSSMYPPFDVLKAARGCSSSRILLIAAFFAAWFLFSGLLVEFAFFAESGNVIIRARGPCATPILHAFAFIAARSAQYEQICSCVTHRPASRSLRAGDVRCVSRMQIDPPDNLSS